MRQSIVKRTFAILLSASMAFFTCVAVAVAMARQQSVKIQNHTQAGDRTEKATFSLTAWTRPRLACRSTTRRE